MEDCDNVPPAEENTEGSANDMASTSDQNMEEDCAVVEKNMEEDCGNNMPSISEQNMEVSVNIASTSEQNMEEDCVDSTASTSEQNTDLGSGSDLERCSNCKAGLNYNEEGGCVSKVKISTFIDAKTAKILFPHLPASDFICTECVTMVKSKTKFNGFNKRRTLAGSGSSSVDSTPPPSKQDKTKGTVGGGGVPSLHPAPTSTQNTEGSKGPKRPKMSRDTVVGPSASMLKMAGSVKKPPKQNKGSSVKAPSTSKPNVKGTGKVPPAFKPPKGSLIYGTVLPTNWNVRVSANNDDRPCPSEENAEDSGSKIIRCSLCKKELHYDAHKSLPRIRISKLVDLKTAQVLLPHLSPEEFICRDPCQKWVHSKTKKSRCKSKRTWTGFSMTKYPLPQVPRKIMRMDLGSTKGYKHKHEVSTSVGPEKPPKKVTNVNKAIGYLRNRQYVSAIRRLLEVPAATAAFNKVCQEIIRKERIQLARDKEGPFRKQLTSENLSSFSWKKTNAWIEEKAPLTLKCLQGMFPQAQKITGQYVDHNIKEETRRAMTEEEAQQLVDKRIAMATSIALFTGSNRTQSFVQSLIGVEMWREGCPQKMFKIMNSLGVSQSRVQSRQHIVRLQDDHDKELKLWKGQIEKELKIPKRTIAFKSLANRVPAYSLTWDRVKITSNAKHERLGGNKPMIWAFRFAHKNRIPFSVLQGPLKKAIEVSPNSILPSKQTYEALRQRMKAIVMRIIVDNLTALEGLRSKVVWHIPHLYSKQMKEKSNVVNLGAVPVDSSTTYGDTEIMDGLIEYVPTLSEKPHEVLCCSDGLNIDTTEETSDSTAKPTFEGLVDAPPECHKESLCYQDIMQMLFSEKSLEARGSLSQLKSVFAVRGTCIEGKCKETIQRVWDLDFITFATSAYITLYAATECNLDAVDGQPSDLPTDAQAQMEWLSGLSHRLVDLVWMPPPQEDINTAAATACLSEVERNEVCFCGEEKPGEKLVQCCSNLCGGVWFHEGCAPIDPTTDPTVTQDWFCSSACQGDGTYIYCHCKEQRGGQMVQCALMDQCRRHEWYHKDCLSLSDQDNAVSEESTWYCSEMCFIASDADDHVLNYTKALVWEGLYNMARRDAIKEGDGEAMTDFWKMDMVLFWARKHLKDFTTCHRLLTGIEGFYPEHIRQDLKWNRVVNLEGKPGCNISLDLVNEFMNIEFKESLGRVSDHYTNERMELCGMMAGAIGSKANRLLITLGAGNGSGLATSLASSHVYKRSRQADIAKFVAEYKKDHLFRYIPGRAHEGFEKFIYQQKIKTPKKMGKMMRNLAQDMDQQ